MYLSPVKELDICYSSVGHRFMLSLPSLSFLKTGDTYMSGVDVNMFMVLAQTLVHLKSYLC
jgi:hypothetical protein